MCCNHSCSLVLVECSHLRTIVIIHRHVWHLKWHSDIHKLLTLIWWHFVANCFEHFTSGTGTLIPFSSSTFSSCHIVHACMHWMWWMSLNVFELSELHFSLLFVEMKLHFFRSAACRTESNVAVSHTFGIYLPCADTLVHSQYQMNAKMYGKFVSTESTGKINTRQHKTSKQMNCLPISKLELTAQRLNEHDGELHT